MPENTHDVDALGEAHKPDADLLVLHPCPCENDCPCDKLEAWVALDKKLTARKALPEPQEGCDSHFRCEYDESRTCSVIGEMLTINKQHVRERDEAQAALEAANERVRVLEAAVAIVVNDLMLYDDLPFVVDTYANAPRETLTEDAAALGDAVRLLCKVAAAHEAVKAADQPAT